APYGEPLNRTVDGPGYTGHVHDAATGLVYAQQRYYDPIIGRFLSIDPVAADPNSGSNFNRYWYANNNPYKFTDPDGRESKNEEKRFN
ncbi:MAG: RHS repeat-associated core domain-containing protein, partial [Xanthomonadaceae bacterium]|nr:RHS repeat-associated core domain-containing protein [Xanthomonadaceae bacterium]